jgi:dolichol-phosphate mannosyltransferase
MPQSSLSVIIPCLNEEENLKETYENVVAALTQTISTYEILIFNDGSTDRTGIIADEIARLDSAVIVHHNEVNQGFGYNFIKGVEIAKMDYVTVIPGDNEISGDSIRRIFCFIGKADIVTSFSMNMEIRPYSRRLVSRLFTLLINCLFCCELQYYNGPTVHRVDLIRGLKINTVGFAFHAVTLVKLIRQGYSFCEVDTYLQRKNAYRSTAVQWRNIISVVKAILSLFLEIRREPSLRNFAELRRINPHLS